MTVQRREPTWSVARLSGVLATVLLLPLTDTAVVSAQEHGKPGWVGTLEWGFTQPNGRQRGRLDIKLDLSAGQVTGRLTGEEFYEWTIGPCKWKTEVPNRHSYVARGEYTPGSRTLSFQIADNGTVLGRFVSGPCPPGPQPHWGGAIPADSPLQQHLKNLPFDEDGNVKTTFVVAPATLTQFTLQLRAVGIVVPRG